MNEIILLLEDDATLLRAVEGILKLEGYQVLACPTIEDAHRAVWEQTPDLMVLDVMLPDGSGIDFCRAFRASYGAGAPVLFLTALGQQEDVLAGYGAGGADYLVKPFDLDILLLKLRSLLESRRAALERIVIGPLELDCLARSAFVDGGDLQLTPKEYAVLEYLARNRGRYSPSFELYQAAWGAQALVESTVRQHIYHLREKLGQQNGIGIASCRGKGYRLVRM